MCEDKASSMSEMEKVFFVDLTEKSVYTNPTKINF